MQAKQPKPSKNRSVTEHYDNANLKMTGEMRDGEMHGRWQWFRRDGSLMREGEFEIGKQVGIWRTFDRTGQLVKETNFSAKPAPAGKRANSKVLPKKSDNTKSARER